MARRKNPIEEYEALEKTSSERHQQDLQLWHAWDQGGRKKEDLAPILQRFDRFIGQQSQFRSPNMDEAAHKSAIQNEVAKAVSSFDPSYGVALSTHVIGRTQGSKRWLYQHADTGRIPEKKFRAIGTVQTATEELRDQFGRDPTHHEVAMHLTSSTGKTWKPKEVETISRLAGVKDVLTSSYGGAPDDIKIPRHEELAGGMVFRQEVAANAPAKQRDLTLKVYDHIWGVNGAQQIRDTGTLARKYGVPESTISRIKTHIQNVGSKML